MDLTWENLVKPAKERKKKENNEKIEICSDSINANLSFV
jgi:hypothetical protein